MSVVENQHIALSLTDDDKCLFETAAAISQQSLSQFILSSAHLQALEIIEQHQRIILNETSWARVMDALGKSPSPGEKLQRSAKQLEVFSGITGD
ncbi:DUF1778 domain-containing protein [Escherichia coli]|uniref:DUF1778 domain-containing protein n=1 Tax=Escherichia coli TaxID=562 RepID=A0AAI9FDQ6_ECOLX|nr:DUF1778 domain-containing protein [Escherichia coli]HDQ6536435.1 DUF1778 domain-containing protein [Escherichia coli O36:H14]ANO91376.1 toxin-antitoxin system, antitoxin component [Escherichia coli]EFI6952930.1 DUF1778 domain-containing protein [Escherichia coli]EFN1900846.1 DUF1778 domain-containing protein [Escherichia coli]EHR9386417.1 DUF1778 domain-containing protein [Escherichia coli]